MKRTIPALFALLAACAPAQSPLLAPGTPQDRPPEERISKATLKCLGCHETCSPGLVEDWRSSRHSRVTPTEALARPAPERRVSAASVPEKLKDVVVGCYECHGLNPDAHKDNFKHMGQLINVVVSPDDCRTCHPVEADEFAGSKKAHAVDNLLKNPLFEKLVSASLDPAELKEGKLAFHGASDAVRSGTCFGCHGTVVTVAGMKKVESDLGEIEVPDLTDWPNQGVGRVNPDGSRGACTACHPRHGFSIEVARKPHTCAQCHLEPDTPAWEVYAESKHGNLYLSQGGAWNWTNVPWKVGTDFRAPTCAACHNSMLAAPNGDVIVPRTHDFGARLWVRLFGLPYAHPQPKKGATHEIRNKDGQPLPTTLAGEPAASFLIDEKEQGRRRDLMKKVCLSCHGTSWTDGHFDRLAATVEETNRMTRTATDVLRRADPANPFDETIERAWVESWLFHATSIRYAAAMSGPDYATFKNGWWNLTRGVRELHERAGERK